MKLIVFLLGSLYCFSSVFGMEVFKRYLPKVLKWRQRRMWMLCLEYLFSVTWSYIAAAIIVLWIIGQFFTLPGSLYIASLIPGWSGVALGITCLLQFSVSLLIDSRYDRGIGKYYYWMIWYPIAYWMLNTFTVVVAVPKALLKKDGTKAIWKSPDRGVH